MDPADQPTPEFPSDRRWAQMILSRVQQRLQAEYAAAGKEVLFTELKGFLFEKQEARLAEVAARLGVSASAVSVATHRLRRHYAQMVREEVQRPGAKLALRCFRWNTES